MNGIQETIPLNEMGHIAISAPQTDREFWQQIYLKNHLYEYFSDRGYKHKLRQEIDEECLEYLDKLNEIAYQEDYIVSYVQGVFSKLNATTIDSNRGESLNIRIIQSPEPDAFMLPNGSMVISTGLLCTLDSEDELAAVIACELGHFRPRPSGKQHFTVPSGVPSVQLFGRCLCHYRQCSPRCGLLGR